MREARILRHDFYFIKLKTSTIMFYVDVRCIKTDMVSVHSSTFVMWIARPFILCLLFVAFVWFCCVYGFSFFGSSFCYVLS